MNQLVCFDREFRLWLYNASHSQLLLRSVKGQKYQTQVDVLFKSTIFVCLPSQVNGLIVSEMSQEEFATLNMSTGRIAAKWGTPFLVRGEDWSGVIVAGRVAWLENEAEYYEQSGLITFLG